MEKNNNKGSFLDTLPVMGANIASNLFGTIINRVTAERDRELNYQYNELAAENALNRQEYLYNKYYSPSAMLEQYKNAGLSPGLMYQTSGSVGTQTPSAPMSNSVNGIQTQNTTFDLLNNALLKAQINNINADTENKEANTEERKSNKILIDTDINKIIAETDNINAKTELTNLQSQYQELQNYITENTKENDIEQSELTTALIEEQIEQLMLNNDITRQSKKEIIESYKLANQQTIANIILTNAQTNLTNEQAKKISYDIWIALEDLKLDALNTTLAAGQLKARFTEIDNNYKINVANTINNYINTIGNLYLGYKRNEILEEEKDENKTNQKNKKLSARQAFLLLRILKIAATKTP